MAERVQVSDWIWRRLCRYRRACNIGDGDNFLVNVLVNFEPLYGFKNRLNEGESSGFRKSTSSRVKNQLKTIKLRVRKVETDRVAIAFDGMIERCK